MASEEAPTLEKLWLGGRTGTLAVWSEAKAWALRVVWKQAHEGNTHGLNTYVAGKLQKIGGGQPTSQAPFFSTLKTLTPTLTSKEEHSTIFNKERAFDK